MGQAMIIVRSDTDREKAASWARKAPDGTRIQFKRTKRSLGQNDKLWACLTDVAEQVEWYGQKLSTHDWKNMFTASLRKARVVPGIDAGTSVVLGLQTSDMDRDEISNLLELIMAFGSERGVIFNDPQERAA